MSILLFSDQMTEPQDTPPLTEQDSTRGVRLLLNRCVSFSLNSSPTLKRHRSNLIADPLAKDSFTLHVGSQAHAKRKLLDPKTFDTFVRKEEIEKDSSCSPKSSNKDSPSTFGIQKSILANKNQEYKRNKSTGKMYVNELWSKKHYYEIINSSDLAKQQEETIRKSFQTTEERVHEINELCKAKLGQKGIQGKYLLDKYQKRELITEEDLSLKSDLDLQFAAEKSKVSIQKSRTRLLRRSGIKDLGTSIKEEEEDANKKEVRYQKKKPNTILLPSLEKSSQQILKFKGHAASTNTSPDINRLFVSMKAQNSRHLNKVRLRGQESESELKTTDHSPTAASLRSSKIFQSIGGISFQNDNEVEPVFSESRVSLIKIVQNCKQFNNDKTAMKLVDDISYNYGPNKYLKDAKDQREKREKLKKQSLLEKCVHLHQERKKKEKSLYH